MAAELFDLLIFLIVVCLMASLVLWAISRWFPDVYQPARYIIGGLVLIAILVKLKPFILMALA